MKNTIRKILALSTATITFTMQLFGTLQTVVASEKETITYIRTDLTNDQADLLSNLICKSIANQYDGIYDFDNFQLIISNQKTNMEYMILDVDVTADMTLIKSPKDSQYVKGMENAINSLTDQNEIQLAQKRLEEYLDQAMPCYNETIPVGFEYQIHIPIQITTSNIPETEIELYHKIDTDNEPILTKLNPNETFTEQGNYLAGEMDIVQYIQNSTVRMNSTRAVSYSRASAVAYAVAHAMDPPEYNADNGGSDCANFVSKCIHAGGIPTGGVWYPGGDDWIRTGFYNNGGVVPYMRNKGYYAAVSYAWQSTLASSLDGNTKSHVAIVTRIDGYNILYSHHSNVTKTNTYYLYNSGTDNVTFYVPQI